MGIMWKIMGNKIKEEINHIIGQKTDMIEREKNKLENTVNKYEEIIQKYGEFFKGFSSPNQYMSFVLREYPDIRRFLIHKALCEWGNRFNETDFVSYIDMIKLEKYSACYTAYPNHNYVKDDDMFILGALDFGKKTTGDIKIRIRGNVCFVGHVSNETWLPLMDLKNLLMVEPNIHFTLDSPVKPKLFVLRVERKGKTII